jgi:uncharacterized membrane protein YkoI
MWRVLNPAIVATFAVAIVSIAGQTAEPGCVEWSQAGPIIAQNSLVSANVIYQVVQKRLGGRVVSQALCNVGGRFVYKLGVLGPTGAVINVTVDARTGQF